MRKIIKRAFRSVVKSLPAEQSLALQFFRCHRRFPNLKNPRTFSEKVQLRKLNARDPRFRELADKVRVKEHVSKMIGEQFVIPSFWSGKGLPPVEARSWPTPFVIALIISFGLGVNALRYMEGCSAA